MVGPAVVTTRAGTAEKGIGTVMKMRTTTRTGAALLLVALLASACSRMGDEPVPYGANGGYSGGGTAPSAGPAASAPVRCPAAARCPAPRSATACSSPSTSRRSTPEAMGILNAQIGWLERQPDAAGPDRGPCRRARHHRVQPRPRLEPRERRAQLHGEPGRAGQPDLDHHLWPRAPGGDLPGGELLRAEPPCCHGRDWRNRGLIR